NSSRAASTLRRGHSPPEARPAHRPHGPQGLARSPRAPTPARRPPPANLAAPNQQGRHLAGCPGCIGGCVGQTSEVASVPPGGIVILEQPSIPPSRRRDP